MIPRKRLVTGIESSAAKRVCTSDRLATHSLDPVTEALERLRRLFPVKDFLNRLPPIIWKQQVYAACSSLNRTEIDRKLNILLLDGSIRFVKLGSTVTQNDSVIVFLEDLRATSLSERPGDVTDSLNTIKESVISRENLANFTDEEIQLLITTGLLAVNRTVGTWLLSIPGAGTFVKSFTLGRKVLQRTIRSTKFNEISIRDLEKRKLPKQVRLCSEYLILELN